MNYFARFVAVTGMAVTVGMLFGCDKDTDTRLPTEEDTPKVDAKNTELGASPSQSEARVFIVSPADGATVSSPVTVEFGVEGMAIVPAGTNQPFSGHHHLLINTGMPAGNLPIPADDQHKHYGDGSTTTTIELPPGNHTLTLLLGDYLHIPHDPPLLSKTISITVE